MPISLLSKKEIEKGPAISARLLRENTGGVAASGVLLLVLVVYGALLGYESFLHREVEETRARVEAIQKQRDIEAEEGARDLGLRITRIRSLLDDHPQSKKLFEFVQDMTHPYVQLTSFNFEITNNTLTLEGAAPNYAVFGEQIIALEQSENVADLEIVNVERGKDGQIKFGTEFAVDEAVYR